MLTTLKQCDILNEFDANKLNKHARVAQWWSIALPRRGPRVRIPSRAFYFYLEVEKEKVKGKESSHFGKSETAAF